MLNCILYGDVLQARLANASLGLSTSRLLYLVASSQLVYFLSGATMTPTNLSMVGYAGTTSLATNSIYIAIITPTGKPWAPPSSIKQYRTGGALFRRNPNRFCRPLTAPVVFQNISIGLFISSNTNLYLCQSHRQREYQRRTGGRRSPRCAVGPSKL
jgi:hypothetical protein